MKPGKRQLGNIGEDLAAAYLVNHGYTLIGRNIRFQTGELDLICVKDQVLVTVEVKTRRGMTYGYPEEAVTPKKLGFLTRATLYYASLHPQLPKSLRIEVIGIILDAENRVTYFKHLENIT